VVDDGWTACAWAGCSVLVPDDGRSRYCWPHHVQVPADQAKPVSQYRPRQRKGELWSLSAWRARSRAFLAEHPRCDVCGAPATIAHHVHLDGHLTGSRVGDEALAPMCASCHSRLHTTLRNEERRKAKLHRAAASNRER
jgi:hypothetical protein